MPQVAGFRGVLGALGDLAALASKRDPGRAVYRYHQIFPGPPGRTLVRKNLIAAVRLAPWAEGTIRPHLASDPAVRDAALAAIRASRAHAAPFVAGVHDQAGEVERLMRRFEAGAPALERTTADGTQHRVWRVGDAETLGKLRHYFAPKRLHVLEGHERYEAMLAYHEELAGRQALATYSSASYGLACLVALDDPALASAARHRVVRGTGLARDAVLAAAGAHFLVDKLAGARREPARLHAALADTVAHQPAFVAVFAGDADDAYKLTLKPEVSPFAEGAAPDRALQKLDPVVVDNLFVARHLPGATATSEGDLAGALASDADVVLVLRPLSIEQILHVAELGQRLPTGATGLHPAIADDLVAMLIDPDEDLV